MTYRICRADRIVRATPGGAASPLYDRAMATYQTHDSFDPASAFDAQSEGVAS